LIFPNGLIIKGTALLDGFVTNSRAVFCRNRANQEKPRGNAFCTAMPESKHFMKIVFRCLRLPVTVLTLAYLWTPLASRAQGSLTPSGAPGATMRTLLQVEPRTPISSLPFTISSPGSYFVTTNLTGTSGQNGITITANNVTLDLRGFMLTGVAGSLNGIQVSVVTNLSIHDGSVTSWGAIGVNADSAQNAHLSDLSSSLNGSFGINPGFAAIVSRCTAIYNGSDGFSTLSNSDASCSFERCSAFLNDGQGFATYDKCIFEGCSAAYNDLDGFNPYFDCKLVDCTANENGFDGVDDVWNGCTVINCACDDNSTHGVTIGDGATVRGTSATGNGGIGILTGNHSVVDGCATAYNEEQGIEVANFCSLSACSGSSNQLDGIATGGGCTLSHCTAGGSITGNGITLGSGSIATGCAAYANSSNGIDAGDRSSVLSSTATFNGNAGIHVNFQGTVQQCTSGNNGFYGILSDASGYALILQNNCTFNGLTSAGGTPTKGAGIYITNSPGCRIEANVLNLNYAALVVATGNHALVIRNSADGSVSTSYSLGTGNSWGPIVNVSAGGDISTVSNSSHPDANFIH
jgi:hypothetical protein